MSCVLLCVDISFERKMIKCLKILKTW